MLDQSYYEIFDKVDFRKPIQHIISVGGGLSSTIELPLEVIRKYGAENVHLVICALKGEHEDLWNLVKECERLTGLKVTRISYDPIHKYVVDPQDEDLWDIWDVFNNEHMMGNSLADPCSRILKRETIKHYISKNFHPSFTVLHVGITSDEIDRTLNIAKNWKRSGYKVEFDLLDVDLSEERNKRCEDLVGWVPETYKLGFSHNNCGGFCVKAGHAQMARLLWYKPDIFFHHAKQEKEFQENNNTTATIMRDRKTTNKVTKSTPLTLYEFADRMNKKWKGRLIDPFDKLDETPSCKWCEAI